MIDNQQMRQIAQAIRPVFSGMPENPTRLLLETVAGQGTPVGHSIEQLADFLDMIGDPGRTGICVDTCQMFAAGYDFRSDSAYEEINSPFLNAEKNPSHN